MSEKQEQKNEDIREFGQVALNNNRENNRISLLTIIGEIEGHDCLPATTKTTKYEHVLPKLAEMEDNRDTEGILLLLNTVGGDVESGLAIAEMVASISKPTVSLVLGGSHSIGVPLAVSTDYSFIVPSGTMVIHPVRMSGTVIGAKPTYDYFKQMQNRILTFIASHSRAVRREAGGTDDEHGNADKRPWNHFSRGGSGPGRADRCRGRNRCRVFKTACDD